jgi:hypothetical protein
MPTFQKSTYLDSFEFIIFFLSTDLDASLPQIRWYIIGLGILACKFGELFGLASHNLIEGPSIELRT